MTDKNKNEERIAKNETPVIAYRDPESGETKERKAETDGSPAITVFPEPTGTDGPQ